MKHLCISQNICNNENGTVIVYTKYIEVAVFAIIKKKHSFDAALYSPNIVYIHNTSSNLINITSANMRLYNSLSL